MLDFTFNQDWDRNSDTLVVFAQNEQVSSDLDLAASLAAANFSGEKEQIAQILGLAGYHRLVVFGLGEISALDEAALKRCGAKLYAALAKNNDAKIHIDFGPLAAQSQQVALFLQGMLMRAYRFEKYRTTIAQDKQVKLASINAQVKDASACSAAFTLACAQEKGISLCKDLVNEPANKLTPLIYAQRIKEAFAGSEVSISVLEQEKLEELGMGALLGVAQGSVNPPAVVVMEYKGNKKDPNAKPLALVGKGVTFDTGGISLKPPAGMWDMKWDMGGSAITCGAMMALSARKAQVNLVGIVGLVENMPDGNAQRPGDIVTSMSGQTIEVLNTDAEGRLVLADVMTYVQREYDPVSMIDFATLTGAILIALGSQNAGLFSNDDALADALLQAGKQTGDHLWRMPIGEDYNRLLNCDIADIKNISSGREAGATTAACFLERFVDQGRSWAHLDVAGVVHSQKELPLSGKGATGYGVQLIDTFVKNRFEG